LDDVMKNMNFRAYDVSGF